MNDDATLRHVTSADGTTLAYERHGDGPAVILIGGKSFPFLRQTAESLAEAIPDARTDVLEGQEHVVDPTVLAPAVTAFLKG